MLYPCLVSKRFCTKKVKVVIDSTELNEDGELVPAFEYTGKCNLQMGARVSFSKNKEEIKPLLIEQVSNSVLWEDTIRRMLADGVDTFVEIGPGKVLAGLNKKIAPEATVYNVFDKASLDATVAALKEQMAGV